MAHLNEVWPEYAELKRELKEICVPSLKITPEILAVLGDLEHALDRFEEVLNSDITSTLVLLNLSKQFIRVNDCKNRLRALVQN